MKKAPAYMPSTRHIHAQKSIGQKFGSKVCNRANDTTIPDARAMNDSTMHRG